jgi:hypothetical protein
MASHFSCELIPLIFHTKILIFLLLFMAVQVSEEGGGELEFQKPVGTPPKQGVVKFSHDHA